MGQTLSEPVVEKDSHRGGDNRLIYGLSSMQGWRISMEDAHAAILDLQNDEATKKETTPNDRLSFFGVYDGHGGDKVALFSGENIHKILTKQAAFEQGDFKKALQDAFLATDRAILADTGYEDEVSGCTASVALITGTQIYVANAGDSRTVLGTKGRAHDLSSDHKPQNEDEMKRITHAGGFVQSGRVNGNLALSRAIGDFEFKKSAHLAPDEQIVTAFPDVTDHEIGVDDEFIVVACDGIWDCQSSQAVIEFVRRGIVADQPLEKICENLMNRCLAPSSDIGGVGCDNMTMMIIGLLQGKSEEEWRNMIKKRVENGEGPCAPPEYAEFCGPGQQNNKTVQPRGGAQQSEEANKKEDQQNQQALRAGGRIIVLGDSAEVDSSSDVADGNNEPLEKPEEDAEALNKPTAKNSESNDTEMTDAPSNGEAPAATNPIPTGSADPPAKQESS